MKHQQLCPSFPWYHMQWQEEPLEAGLFQEWVQILSLRTGWMQMCMEIPWLTICTLCCSEIQFLFGSIMVWGGISYDTKTNIHFFNSGLMNTFMYKVRVATMTHNHDDTAYAIFNAFVGTRWKVSEVIDFDLRNRNSDLSACLLAFTFDSSQFIEIPLSKTTKTVFCEYLQIYYLWTHESEVSELHINLFVLKFSFCWYTILKLRTMQLWNQEEEIIFAAFVYMTYWTNCHHDHNE